MRSSKDLKRGEVFGVKVIMSSEGTWKNFNPYRKRQKRSKCIDKMSFTNLRKIDKQNLG